MARDETISLPLVIEIEPTLTCNLRCRMCHVSFMPDEPRAVLNPKLIDKLSGLTGVHTIIGAGFEPMMHKNFADIVRRLNRFGAKIELLTNGTLFSEKNLSAVLDADISIMNFSFDGIREGTYEHIRRKAKHGATLDAIQAVRARFAGRDTRFAINTTMMRCNMAEIDEIVDFWEGADFDLIRFITMVVRANDQDLLRNSLYPVREEFHDRLDSAAERVIRDNRRIALSSPRFAQSDLAVRYPANVVDGVVSSLSVHTRHVPDIRKATEVGAGPGMTFPCKSPWTFARITSDADVKLCQQFTIGNLGNDSFEDIWFGEKASRIRDLVRADERVCKSCDYYRFCLRSREIKSESLDSYFAGPLLEAADTVDFEQGTMRFQLANPPKLLESIGHYNIVSYGEDYFALPVSIGVVDLTTADYDQLPGLIRAKSLKAVREQVAIALTLTDA